MVASGTIKRLEAALDAIEQRLGGAGEFMALEMPEGMDEEAVIERHRKRFPEFGAGGDVAIFRTLNDDPDSAHLNGNPQRAAAWREIAREERARLGEAEWRRARALRRLRSALCHLAGPGYANNGTHRDAAFYGGLVVCQLGFPEDEALAFLRDGGVDIYDTEVRDCFDQAAIRGGCFLKDEEPVVAARAPMSVDEWERRHCGPQA